MIVGLRGILEGVGADAVSLRVGGVSFLVHLPASILARLGPLGEEVSLHTHLHLREDGVALYGFASVEELGLFHALLGVSGVGPRLALALLSALPPDQLRLAIVQGNVDLLTQVPGIGKKTAQRLVLELKDRLGRVGVSVFPTVETDSEALAALTGLGFSLAEARRALASLPADPQLALEEKIRLALQQLGGK